MIIRKYDNTKKDTKDTSYANAHNVTNYKVGSISLILVVGFDACYGMSLKHDYKFMWLQYNLDLVFMIWFLLRSDQP